MDESNADQPPPLPDGAFELLAERHFAEMEAPPEALSGSEAFALVGWEWWIRDESSKSLVIDADEIPPWDVEIPTMESGSIRTVVIESRHPPTRLYILGFEALSEDGGADIDTQVLDITCSTAEADCVSGIRIDDERTVIEITPDLLPEIAMLIVQADWAIEEFIQGEPLISSTWATYLDD